MWKPKFISNDKGTKENAEDSKNKGTKEKDTNLKDKKVKEKNKKANEQKESNSKNNTGLNIAFNILAVFCIAVFCIAIVPKTFQNDTFYTIKIGQLIRENGIDYQDHFSWHENLPYMYPHWAYDVIISLLFDYAGGYTGLYISTIILSILLGVLLYFTNKKISKNPVISLVLTIGQMELMREYVATRAQMVTFVLFVATILLIVKFLEKPKWWHTALLIIIPIIIANVHSAVFPFYFILYLPFIAEYAIAVVLDWHIPHKVYQMWIKRRIKFVNNKLKKAKKDKVEKYQAILVKLNKLLDKSNQIFETDLVKQNERRKKPYKIIIEKNKNVLKLFIIMIICLFTGLLTPIKDMPYMYTYKIMQGNTTDSISEHLPLTLIENIPILVSITVTLALAIFTKVKLKLRDVFFFGGLTLLALMTRRQSSMLILFGGMVLCSMISSLIDMYDKNGTEEFMKYTTSILGEILSILLIFVISYKIYKPNKDANYINTSSYPVEAVEWIKKNLDYKNIKLFNDYNYGSYLLLNDIPVFIDSRCDLYTPEFNGTYNKEEKKYEGQDIFSDYISISSVTTWYDTKLEEYGVQYVMCKTNSKLKMLISRDSKYEEKYKDSNFMIYERKTEDLAEE